jgi:hypothetical protein
MDSSRLRGIVIFAALASTTVSNAYDLGTHWRISEFATGRSQVQRVLGDLGLTVSARFDLDHIRAAGVNTGTAFGWIREGSVVEDGDSDCDSRVRHHFYNPLDNGGYLHGVVQGTPSADWGLEDGGSIGGQESSYADARSFFWSALTATTETDRQRNLALTLRSIGQVIHLLQDAAQPQHTRNDSHAGLTCPLTLGLFGPKSLYEWYAEALAQTGGLPYSGYANVSFPGPRDYWDDEAGRGIAEFSNRNFVSAGTNFLGPPEDLQPALDLPSPNGDGARADSVDIQELLPGTPLRGTMTFIGTPYDDRYSRQADFNARTSTYSILTADLAARGLRPRYTLNRFNFDAALALLVPRAVGYSAGMIDYFFRGTLEIAPPDRFSYLVAPYRDGDGQFTQLKVKVRNTTPAADTGEGTVQAVVRFRKAHLTDPLLYPAFASLDAEPSYAVSKPIENVSLGRDFQALDFDFSESPIPVKIGDLSLIVAFRGPLIDPAFTESDAVAFGGKDVFEPQLIDFGNSTDYDCYQSTLFDVAGATAQQRDLNLDGRQDLFGPVTETGAYVKLQSSLTPADWFAPDAASFASPGFRYAEFARFVAVQDQPQYLLMTESLNIVDDYSGDFSQHLAWFTIGRSINRLVEQDGELVHEVSAYSAGAYRGTSTPLHTDLVNSNVYANPLCRNAIPSVGRPMRETSGSPVGEP